MREEQDEVIEKSYCLQSFSEKLRGRLRLRGMGLDYLRLYLKQRRLSYHFVIKKRCETFSYTGEKKSEGEYYE